MNTLDAQHRCAATDDTVAGCPTCFAAAEAVVRVMWTYDPKDDGKCKRCSFARWLHCIVCLTCNVNPDSGRILPVGVLPDLICGNCLMDFAHGDALEEDAGLIAEAHDEALANEREYAARRRREVLIAASCVLVSSLYILHAVLGWLQWRAGR